MYYVFMTHKRKQNRVEMAQRIFAALEQLILVHGSTDFSMSRLAETAGVAPVTPYKHFDTKAGVLAGLLQQLLSEPSAQGAERAQPSNEIDRVIAFAVAQAGRLVEREELTRPILAGLARLDDGSPYMAGAQWEPQWLAELRPAFDAGLLHAHVNAALAARALHTAFYGACRKWQAYEISSAQFVADVRYGTTIVLLGIATSLGEPMLRHRFAEAQIALVNALEEPDADVPDALAPAAAPTPNVARSPRPGTRNKP